MTEKSIICVNEGGYYSSFSAIDLRLSSVTSAAVGRMKSLKRIANTHLFWQNLYKNVFIPWEIFCDYFCHFRCTDGNIIASLFLQQVTQLKYEQQHRKEECAVTRRFIILMFVDMP
jgi:hypothetical protein